jgi:hypothetical protein
LRTTGFYKFTGEAGQSRIRLTSEVALTEMLKSEAAQPRLNPRSSPVTSTRDARTDVLCTDEICMENGRFGWKIDGTAFSPVLAPPLYYMRG